MTTKTKPRPIDVTRWREPGAAGFWNFVEDVRPCIPNERGGWSPYEVASPRVRAEIDAALSGKFSTIIFSWPRRHGKTVAAALVIVWRFLSRQGQTIAIVSNSAQQTVDTAFRTVKGIAENTPYIRALVDSGAINVLADSIHYEGLRNSIQGFPANARSLYGKKLTIAQISELHAARNDEVYQVLASATIDTVDGFVLVDSTVGPITSPLYQLYKLAKDGTDPTIYFSHIEYRDIEDAVDNGPAWIRPERLRSRARQMLPAEFALQHLNQWGAASSAVFAPETIERCKSTYPLDPKSLADGRAYVVGGGLDRALLFSRHGDRTVAAAVLKMLGDDDEPHFHVLDMRSPALSTEGAVKRAILDFKTRLGMSKLAVERYEASDLQIWAEGQGLDAELIHATPGQQSLAFTTLATAAAEGRLHVHPSFDTLLGEMATLTYELTSSSSGAGVVARFAAAKGAHDDFVYALAWAVYALREVELSPYVVNGVHCDAAPVVADLCVLNGGNVVPACAAECRSFAMFDRLYQKYRSKGTLSAMSFEDFARFRVKNVGPKTRQS